MALDGEWEPGTWDWVNEQVRQYEASGGIDAPTVAGRPIVVVTSVGARSGKLRKHPVMRVEHEGRYAAVASKGGADEDPAWVANLQAQPLVELQDGPQRQPMRARELTGDERAQWWARAVEAFPTYADYARKTSRRIPVFLLEPAG